MKLGESFHPHPDMKNLYYAYLLIPGSILAALFSAGSVLVILFAKPPESWVAVLAMVIPYLAAVGFVTYWIPRYFPTVSYALTEDRIVFQAGLWWKRKSYVPYNRITNIDVIQGPLSRHFGIGKVSIQTAGYSGQSSGGGSRFSEIAIFGVKDFEEIKDTIMSVVSRYKPVAVEAGAETPSRQEVDVEILEELKKIGKTIESRSRAT